MKKCVIDISFAGSGFLGTGYFLAYFMNPVIYTYKLHLKFVLLLGIYHVGVLSYLKTIKSRGGKSTKLNEYDIPYRSPAVNPLNLC
jgi:hypothetical protein